ncbi:hypothetical protein DFH29DRAFT_901947 [Suillus ampliporus]|nr:hypothetical protein DFH29DRAFT_901947 [Suillus ampliporus]
MSRIMTPETTLHSTQNNGHVSGGTRIEHSSSPAILGSNSLSSYASPIRYPNVHRSCSLDLPPYNDLSQHWSNFAISQPGPPSRPLPLIIPPHVAAESPQTRFASQPRASHGGRICYCSNQPPMSQPDSDQLHSHPPSPLLLSCRWRRDDGICGFTGTLRTLRAHCQTSHFIGPNIAQIACRWETCDYHKRGDLTVHVMRRNCMWLHTYEIHWG